ncbi:hypothetical protein [Larkinella terrae]
MDYPGSLHNILVELMNSTRYSHKIYFALRIILVGFLFVLVIRKNQSDQQKIVIIILSLLAVFLFRLPNTVLPEQNLDESFMIAGAGVMVNDPFVFKSFDGTTIGPIQYYVLATAYWLLGSINYTSIRIIGLLLSIIPGIFFTYKAIRFLYNYETAKLVLFGYTLCMAGITFFEFVGYSSEVLPHLVISIEMLCLSAIMSGRQFVYAGILCFMAGLMPYAKLQGVPIAGVIVIFLGIELYRQLTFRRFFVLVSLGLLPTILAGIYLYLADLFPDFYASYLLFNLSYSNSSGGLRWSLPWQMLFGNADMPNVASDLIPFFLFTFFSISFLGARLLLSKIAFVSKRRVIYVFILLGIAWFSVIKSGQGFQHYLFFFFAPLFWGLGIILGENRQIVSSNLYKYGFYIPFLLFFLLQLLNKNKGIEYAYRPLERPDPIALLIRKLAQPSDQISIWGHGNLAHIYCHTGLLPGTRDVFASRQINPSTLQPYFIRRYMDDIRRNRPRFILEDTHYKDYQTKFNSIDSSFISAYRVHSILDGVKVYVRE